MTQIKVEIPKSKVALEKVAAEIKRASSYIIAAASSQHLGLNDVSDRTTGPMRGASNILCTKSRPPYCPIGPCLNTGVEGINLVMWTKLNGHLEQPGNTSDMLFNRPSRGSAARPGRYSFRCH